MLTGNQKQHENGRDRDGRPSNFEPQSPRNRKFIPEERHRDTSSRERQHNRQGLPSRDSRLGQRQRSKLQSRREHSNQREASRERDRAIMQA